MPSSATASSVTALLDRSDDLEVGPTAKPIVPPARCADGNGTLSHLFFSDDDHDIARAKAICGRCARQASCLADAVERAEPCGVWGGKVFVDGEAVDVKRRRGRPPKHPAPILVVDEVPVPPHLVA